jgi:hypothetical protein
LGGYISHMSPARTRTGAGRHKELIRPCASCPVRRRSSSSCSRTRPSGRVSDDHTVQAFFRLSTVFPAPPAAPAPLMILISVYSLASCAQHVDGGNVLWYVFKKREEKSNIECCCWEWKSESLGLL